MLVVTVLVSGCSFGHSKSGAHSVSAFDVKPGQCVLSPKDVRQEISDLQVVPCDKAHTQEAYAVVKYDGTGSDVGAAYPSEATLAKFAEGACGQRYESYVGIAYQDSSLFFTYLLPSPRSWQESNDRNVICFVTTTGQELTASVKGTRQ
jgi:hypothetical protein